MRALSLFLLLFAFLTLVALTAPAAAQEEGTMLHILDYKYAPDPLEVPAGSTVIIMNFGPSNQSAPRDDLVHTVTSSDGASFDVTNIPPDFQPYTFAAPATPGTYPYYCRYHGDAQGNGMVGTLVVTEAAPTNATPAGTTPVPSTTPPADTQRETPGAGAILVLGVLVTMALVRRR